MNPKTKRLLQFSIFLVISALLFWLVYKDQDWSELSKVLKEDVDYTWVWISCILGILSHMIRALRWQLLTNSMGYHISFPNSLMGVLIGYFANLAIPRMGEVTRCAVVSRYENVPFSKLLGNVVTERIIDMIILLAMTLLVIFSQFKQVGIFLDNNVGVKEKIMALLSSWWVLFVVVGIIFALILFWRLLLRTKLKDKLSAFWQGLKEGVMSVKYVRNKFLFIIYSLLIWFLYFMMMYICFFSFEFTSHLSLMVGLTIFILGSFGMVAPVQGGIGAWHFMVIAGLMVYLPDVPDIESLSKTFAFLTHGAMTLLYIVLGVLSLIFLPLYNSHRKLKR